MKPDDFSSLEIARFELRLAARQSAVLPAFLGSTLRGAFGHALKQAVCVMEHRDCDRCLVADRCPYPYLFETPVPSNVPQLTGHSHAPHPFILLPPPPRELMAGNTGLLKSLPLEPDSHSVNQSSLRGTSLGLHRPASRRGISASGAAGAWIPGVNRSSATIEYRQNLKEKASSSRLCLTSTGPPLNLAAGDQISFGLVLMGQAIELLPYIVFAVTEMANRGLGVDRARFELSEVLMIGAAGKKSLVYSNGAERITVRSDARVSLSELIRRRLDQLRETVSLKRDSLTLRFTTPTRIRVKADLQIGLPFEMLVRNLLRRISMLCAVHGRAPLELDYSGLIKRASSVETISSRLKWCDWERYSNRQGRKVAMGGFIGEIRYAGEIFDEFLPLMIVGEILSVGSGTVFGLGRVECLPG